MKTYKIEGPLAVDLVRKLTDLRERHVAEAETLEKKQQVEAEAFFAACQAAAGIDPMTVDENDGWYLDHTYVADHRILFLVQRSVETMLGNSAGHRLMDEKKVLN